MKVKTIIISVVLIFCAVALVHPSLFKKKKVDPIYLTMEELKQFDGKEGRRAYASVEGVVYDLTGCKYWKQGIHDKSPEDALAGRDLTDVLAKSDHGIKRIQRFKIGYIIESKE